ncbi:hypothetical protein LNP25_13050 [Klebsiella variicola subsp. variicola]|nr:hypothetical protein [Klebsiella variicola subsp. variicola]
MDLGAVFSRQQTNWQQRAQQLMKRLARRGGQPDAEGNGGVAGVGLRRSHRPTPRSGGGATSWRTAWARCWTPTTRWAAMSG